MTTAATLRGTAADAGASVLIVDDSIVARTAFARMIDTTDRFMVAGAVGSIPAALAFLDRHRVDIVLLDLELPGTSGLAGLPAIIAAGDGARVLVVSSSATAGAVSTLQALAMGAADTLVKPSPGDLGQRFALLLEERLLRLADGAADAVVTPAPARLVDLPAIAAFDIVGIGASTGGIHALSGVLRMLPPGFRQPILVTQHLPPTFMPYFAAQLAVLAGRPCDVAENHMRVRPGRLIVAPGDAHLELAKTAGGAAVRLTRSAAVSGCMPSVDPMFASLAEVYGARALGVVLSGMGRDGAAGAARLAAAGATVLAQDRGSSVVWGMPGAVAASGTARAILPPDAIGRVIAQAGARG